MSFSKGTACIPGRNGRGQRLDITFRSRVGLEVEGKTEEITSFADKWRHFIQTFVKTGNEKQSAKPLLMDSSMAYVVFRNTIM